MPEAATKETTKPVTVTLVIDGREAIVPKGTSVLEAARSVGVDIPSFCYHPKLKSVGSCRMCYVEIEKMPKLQVSCATAAMDGMVVRTDTDQVLQGRRAIIEFLLLDHPLDCPTCDQGGECDLQNLTFAHGVDDSHFKFQKRRFIPDQTDSTFDDVQIGPEMMLNRNRCIRCYKCVRANKEAFGEWDIGAYERGNITEINAAPGQQVDNPFSGNLAEICPVGALTTLDWRYKVRVWLTRTVSTICPFTSSGINTMTFKDGHKNKIYRVTSRCNDAIDDGWIPDVSRYGFQTVHSEDRLQQPLIKKEGKQVPVEWNEALEFIGQKLGEIKEKKGCVCIGGLVSPHLDNRSLYSFNKLLRKVIGTNNIDYRSEYRMLPADSSGTYSYLSARPFSIAEIDQSDVIIVFGSDLLREHPNEYLRIRKAVNFGGARVFVFNPYATKASDVSEQEFVFKPGTDEGAFAALCLVAMERNICSVSDMGKWREVTGFSGASEAASACGLSVDQLAEVATALAGARKVTVIAGEVVSRSKDREAIAAAISNFSLLFGIEAKGQLAILAVSANSRGCDLLGLDPSPFTGTQELLGRLWSDYPEAEPHNTDSMMIQMRKEEIRGCIVMGANPIMLYPDREFAKESLEKLDLLVACDMFETATTELADVVLPLCSWTEYDGDYVNLEGKLQRSHRVIEPVAESHPGYWIAERLAEQMGGQLFESEESIESDLEQLLDSKAVGCVPPTDLLPAIGSKDGEQPDYGIVLLVGDDPHHRGHHTEKAPSLVNFCGEAYVEMPPDMATRLEVQDGDSVRVESPVGKIIVPAKISEQLDTDVVFIPRNMSSTPVTSLLMRKCRIDLVRITKVVK